MSTSTDGGKTWGTPKPTANAATGIGGQPLVQPNGTVIVPIDDANESAVEAFISTNGGTTWGPTVLISTISSHSENGGLRSGPLPSAEIDGAGKHQPGPHGRRLHLNDHRWRESLPGLRCGAGAQWKYFQRSSVHGGRWFECAWWVAQFE